MTSCKLPEHMYHLVVFLMFWTPVTGQTGYLCTKIEEDSLSDFFINLREDTQVDTVIQHLNINGDNTQIELTIAEPNEFIAFDSTTRNLSLVQPVSREETPSINMLIQCKILATQQTLRIQVIVMITDVNDNPPEFTRPEFSVDISELTPPGTTILRDVVATDKDVDNWYITYEIDKEQPFSDFFDIPIKAKGEIVLQKPLDYERNKSMNLRVLAKDNHLPEEKDQIPVQLTSTATISINVLDGDDLNPVFLNTPYFASVIENENVGATIQVVPPIQAVDQDSMNSEIEYSVQYGASDAEEYFSINPTTGELTLKNAAISRGDRYSLLIRATQVDNSDRYATTLVDIQVTAANENPPRFLQRVYTTSVVENTPIGTSVISVNAIDNDQDYENGMTSFDSDAVSVPPKGSVLSYSFANPAEALAFKIDTLGGEVTTTAELDYEVQSEYNITVMVTDGRHTDQCTLVVNVVNLNDNAPRFNQSSYTFSAKRETNYIVGQVQASDRDSDSSVLYFLKDESELFSIDSTGVIRVSADGEDDLQFDRIKLLVAAVDSGVPSLETSVPVYVNFDPPLKEVALARKSESSEVNTIIVIVLGVIGGLLLVIVVILLVYIFKNSSQDKEITDNKPDKAPEIACSRQIGTGLCLQNTSDIVGHLINEHVTGNGHINYNVTQDFDEESADEKHIEIFVARL